MNRRQLFKMIGKTGLGLLVATLAPTSKRPDLVIGVDVAQKEPDRTILSVHSDNDLGGYFVPEEYQRRLLRAIGEPMRELTLIPASIPGPYYIDRGIRS